MDNPKPLKVTTYPGKFLTEEEIMESYDKEVITAFNKSCAVVLGWKYFGKGSAYTMPTETAILLRTGTTVVPSSNSMHFHDSYDWAMLLVKECEKSGYQFHIASDCLVIEDENGEVVFENNYDDIGIPSPHQIAQAALEVLEGEKDG